MAKVSMRCPFSGVLCKDCPVYRGRHFYLCFCEKYRGCLPEAIQNMPMSRKGSNGEWKMPSEVEGVEVFDPFKFDLFDIDTKEQKRRRSQK
jgi:hypothetical protein